jgi:SAM-dependent methyltransferase
MDNPWLGIPAGDYEKHMARIGQLQILNRLLKSSLAKYRPQIFALPGCSTGNGLEHVDNNVTRRVLAIDINPEYLERAKSKFLKKIPGLELIQADIQNYDWCIECIDLIFAGLLLEYVNPEIVLPKMVKALSPNGLIALVIQKNYNAGFVSSTPYKSLVALSAVSHNVNCQSVHEIMTSCGLRLLENDEIPAGPDKSLIFMSYQKQ